MEKDYIICPNPDFIRRKQIEELIKNNNGYCISQEQNDGTKCVCEEFKEQNHSGWCKCGQFYKILKSQKICLCGSTKFKDLFLKIARDLTLQGNIVMMPMLFIHSDNELVNEDERQFLSEVHKAKIADADLIYVINPQGYIGDSTIDEINWAISLGKKIKYLEENTNCQT